jgi:hypothetical protein
MRYLQELGTDRQGEAIGYKCAYMYVAKGKCGKQHKISDML